MSDTATIECAQLAALARHAAKRGLSHLSFSSPELTFDLRLSAPFDRPVDNASVKIAVTSSTPGRIRYLSQPLSVGATVMCGQTIALIEAAYLVFPVTAAQSGVVAAIEIDEDQLVGYGQRIVLLDPVVAQGADR